MRALVLLACASCAAARPELAAVRELGAFAELGEVSVAPDASEVAFTTDTTGAIELFTLALDAGFRPRGAPVQRTHAGEHVTGLAYAPDGRSIVFERDHGGDERTGLWLLRRGAREPVALVQWRDASARGARFSPDGARLAFECDTPAAPFRFGVCVMDLATRGVRRLTHESLAVQSPRWSADGAYLVAARTGDDQHGRTLVLDAATGAVALAPQDALGDAVFWPERADGAGGVLGLAVAPSGFLEPARVALPHGPVALEPSPEGWDTDAIRVADSTRFVARNVHGESQLVTLRAGARRVLSSHGVITALDADAAGRLVVVAREASDHPPELVAIDAATSDARVLFAPPAARIEAARFAPAVRRTFASGDGLALDAFVTTPRAPRLGTPPPLVLLVHGGPNGQARGAFSPTVQALARAGFVVAAVNYRGSTGYGRAFEDANNHDWGGRDLGDLVAVADALADEGSVDRTRTGIMGGSYGGYMTLRALTARPQRFAAGVDMYGMADLAADYRLTGSRFAGWYQTELGDPVHDAALFRERSPIFALDRVRAPLLVMQGANDTNVPRVESDELVAALRARRARVEYVVYPGEGHGFARPVDRADSIARAVAFFSRELGPRR